MKLTVLTLFVATLTGIISTASAQTKTTSLKIRVVKQIWGDKHPRPFSGIGVFDVLRGDSKLGGATCPDKSGATGEITCRIPCPADSEDSLILRIKPPSNQDLLAGWVTPPPQDVQVHRCLSVPALITMQYQDARLALNELLTAPQFASSGRYTGGGAVAGTGAGTYGASTPPASESFLQIIAASPSDVVEFGRQLGSSANGRAYLADVYQLASEATKLKLSMGATVNLATREQELALAKWQLFSKSALLEVEVNRVLLSNQHKPISLEPTTDLTKYSNHLNIVDRFLNDLQDKSQREINLADDIKAIMAIPATGQGAAGAVGIIEKWKQ